MHNKNVKQSRIHRLFGIKVKSKLAAAYMDTAVKILICVVCGALFLTGIYGVIQKVVLPKTESSVTSMFAYESADAGNGGGAGGSGGVETPDVNEEYEMLDGADQTYDVNGATPLSFRSSAPYNDFVRVEINEETVEPKHYTVTEGSTIVTFTNEYSQALTFDEHTIKIVSSKGTAQANFNVMKSVQARATFSQYYDSDKDIYLPLDTPVTLTWDELKTGKDASKYGYDASKISNTQIGDSAFSTIALKEIVIPNTVTSIENKAFFGCKSLLSISISDNVVSIGDRAFQNCTSLTSIDIPSGVTSIGDSAFQKCTSLTSIDIPSGVTLIGNMVFSGCKNLINITIPDGVTSIGDSAFQSCESLTSITIPDSVTSIKCGAFLGCTNLININIPDGVTLIEDCTFQNCESLTSITIPDGVTSIGDSAFAKCTSLTSITIPGGVTLIKEYAFNGCTNLRSITISDSVISIKNWVFNGCKSLTEIKYGGTKDQWKKILTGNNWTLNIPVTVVQCSDGTVSLL